MKSILTAAITCAILFGISFGASMYFKQLADKENAEEKTAEPTDEEAPYESTLPPEPAENSGIVAMPVSHRPDSVSLETVLQMSDSIKGMEERLIIREQRVGKDEQRVKLLFTDLNTEQDELQAFSDGIEMKLRSVEQATASLRELLDTLDMRKVELAEMEEKAGVDDTSQQDDMESRVNKVKAWFENLEAAQAADYLKEFANSGKLEFAAALLQKMPDRQKSKILAALNDGVLVNQLIDAVNITDKK